MRLRKVRGAGATRTVVPSGYPLVPREPSPAPRFADLPWETWAREERARAEDRQSRPRRRYRPSLDLPVDLVERVERVCVLQGMGRSELVEMAIDSYLCSWRARP